MRAVIRSSICAVKRTVRISAVVAAVVASTATTACSTPTTETNVWKSPTYEAGPMKSIAVFAGRVDATQRHTLEDQLASALNAYGVHAIQSYTMFGDQTPPDQSAIRATLRTNGYDGALVSTLQGVSEQVLVAPDTDWGGGFYGAYWGPGAPVYAQTDQFVKFETTLWDPNSGKMVWSTITQTENPTSGKDFATSLSRTVVPSIAKAGLLPLGQPVSLLKGRAGAARMIAAP
jgi:hypothetical protein